MSIKNLNNDPTYRPKCDPKRKSFVMCVSKQGYGRETTEPYLPFEFQRVIYSDDVPDVVQIGSESFVNIGRFAEPGERYSFRRATLLGLVD